MREARENSGLGMALRMLPMIFLLAIATTLAHGKELPPASEFETRCGWFENPTPANVSLFDRDSEWILGMQGGHQVENDWDWPIFKREQWVGTNVGSYGYGYGCACLQLRAKRETLEVLTVKSAGARPLATCREDRALKKK